MDVHSPETADSGSEPLTREVDVSSLFQRFGISKNIRALFTPESYEFADVPADNWLYPAFKAFQRLQSRLQAQGSSVRTFSTIGTGPGLDAVGASHIFHPQHVIATDIKPEVLPVARQNILKNMADGNAQVTILPGNLCAPLREAGLTVDLAYGNLPLLPDDNVSGMRSSTFAIREQFEQVPETYRQYRLAMIYLFLNDARASLNHHGRVLVSLGSRVPDKLIHKLFSDCRYSCSRLCTMLKRQTQPQEVLEGFAEAEKEHRIAFDFYRYDQAAAAVGAEPDMSVSTFEYKRALRPYRVNATEALAIFKNEAIGHGVHILEGEPQG